MRHERPISVLRYRCSSGPRHHLGQAAYLAFDQAQTFLAGSLDAFTYFLYTPTGYWLQVARGRRRPVQTTKVEAVVPGDVRRKILAEIETTQRAQSVLRRPQARPSPRENHSRILCLAAFGSMNSGSTARTNGAEAGPLRVIRVDFGMSAPCPG